MFLKSLRATLIAALSIPLSLIISFVFLHLTGDTLNLMSLGGLAVAIGLIIDDTVVVIENIARHLAEGQTGDAAVDRASREISGAVIGSTLTTILVFLPLAFVRGVVGQFFQSLSMSLTVALLVSMVVSLTIIPVLAARFLGRRPMPTTGPIYNRAGRRLRGAAEGRAPVPEDRRVLLAAAGGRFPGWWLWPRTWRPASCPRWTKGRSSSTTTCRWARRWPRPTRSCAGSKTVLLRDARRRRLHPPHRGRARLLRHRELYRRHPRQPQAAGPAPAGGRDLRRAPRASSRTRSPSWRPSSSRWSRTRSTTWRASSSPIEVKIFGPDLATLRELAEKVGKIVEKVEGAVDVNTHVLLGNPDIVVRPDSVQTARVGLTELDVESQLNAALYGQVASTIPEQDRMTKIRVRYPDRVRFDRENLGQLPISLAMAAPAPVAREPARHGRRDRLRAARAACVDPGRAQPQRALAREPAAGHHRDRRAGASATSARSTASSTTKLAELKFPPGYRWELAGQLPGAAGVVRQPPDGPDRRGGAGLPAAGLPVPEPDRCRS